MPRLKKKKLNAELANGRLAMMAIIGMFFQASISGLVCARVLRSAPCVCSRWLFYVGVEDVMQSSRHRACKLLLSIQRAGRTAGFCCCTCFLLKTGDTLMYPRVEQSSLWEPARRVAPFVVNSHMATQRAHYPSTKECSFICKGSLI